MKSTSVEPNKDCLDLMNAYWLTVMQLVRHVEQHPNPHSV